MARRRASMREGPLAELFRATEAAQKQAEQSGETERQPENLVVVKQQEVLEAIVLHAKCYGAEAIRQLRP